ncbi:hypothetical protein G9A89_001300 [Geosiphon pyriformis]|nr:hypothetical protein G9A89_001300 [Geosiphon pyriformis]
MLKLLIFFTSSQWHWEIAARNLKNLCKRVEHIQKIQNTYQKIASHHTKRRIDKTARTNTNPNLKVAESENIGANHLEFAKSLFQYYSESAFNFYINEKIAYLLGTPVNIKLAREVFYSELIQNTNLPTNHNFIFIITEINKKIKHHTQQRYSITYVSKGKRKLQTPAVTLKRIQPSTWKKTRIESLTNQSYHYISGSTLNITSTGTVTSNMTLAFGQFPFQSKQRKTELLGPYGAYFERFNL